MTLLTIAEIMAGELLISPGGVVDRVTATGEDDAVWQLVIPAAVATADTRELASIGA